MATTKFPKNVQLQDVNPLITCKICGGYFIDATTVTECLHTFCRSCIVKHFKKSLFCPECDVQVERGCPLNKLRPDPRKQLLVYKIVPHLHENEVARQWNFLKKHKPLTASSQPLVSGQRPLLPTDLPDETIRDRIVDKIHLYSPEDKISLSMEYDSGSPAGVVNGNCPADKQANSHKRYLQCPAALTVYHLKKFIRLKYEIGSKFQITIFYEGEALPDDSSLMDIAYQFFYEAKSPMRFTYRVAVGDVLKATENVTSRTNAVPTQSAPSVPVKPATAPTVAVPSAPSASPPTHPVTARQPSRGAMSSAASSSDESTTSNRRQQRQRSAKTAAYSAIEAMDESDHEEQNPPKRRRLAAKSPRWEAERESPEPFPTRVYITRRTPKTSLEDFEARYNTRPAGKRVYATNSDEELSDPETKRNTLANKGVSKYGTFLSSLKAEGEAVGRGVKALSNGKKPRSKKAEEDVYEFNVNEDNEDNEDSNTTQEFDFVYDNSDPENADSDRKKTNGHENGDAMTVDEDMNDVDADEHELEQQIEMEVVTDTEDIDQHIEDSIEEVEVDADEYNQSQEESQTAVDDQLEGETNSSTCLVIAEEDEDDGVVEEVIAAEESGHELVVVEDPDESDVTYTVEVFNSTTPSSDGSEKLSEDASRSPANSSCSKSVEEDEPEIVHEKVFRKKSKKSKHHHHHHHKRKRHHSPVMLISSPEEAPMKLTLKLRPTPSISPGSSTSKSSSKSPLPESPTKEKRVTIALSPRREGGVGETSPAQKIYTVKITSPKPPRDGSDAAVAAKATESDGQNRDLSSAKPQISEVAKEARKGERASPAPRTHSTPVRSSTPLDKKEDAATEKKSVPDDVKERLTQMRQVRIKNTTITASSPVSPPPSPAPMTPKASSCVPDLKSMKTPSSLVISKVEVGEAPPRQEEHTAKKPALEILVLPPSPPPSDRQSDDSEECSTDVSEKKKISSPPPSFRPKASKPAEPRDQTCVLDLSDRTRRDSLPSAHVYSAAVSPVSKYKPQPLPVPYMPPLPGPVANPQLINIHNMMKEATIATMHRMLPPCPSKLPILPTYRDQQGQQRRLVPSLHDILRPVSGFAMPAASRPGPNQSVRHIPNPSALLHRQTSLQHTQDKKEQQLKERYHQFQQNRAAKAAYTYSRVNSPGPGPGRVVGGLAGSSSGPMPGVSASGSSIINNNNLPAKTAAFRARSIEKVAGLLSVRAGAYAVEAPVGL